MNRGKGQQFSALDSFNKTVEASTAFESEASGSSSVASNGDEKGKLTCQ